MRQISMPLVGFEHAVPASELPQTDAVDHQALGLSRIPFYVDKMALIGRKHKNH